MRMTPLDIHSHRFGRRLSGYDPEEVDSFLRMVAEDYESLLRERESLTDQVRQLDRRVQELASNEKLLQETLVSAQAMAEQLRHVAVKESEVLLSEAEVAAQKTLDVAQRRAGQLGHEIREMRGLRTRIASALRAAIETHLALIESLETGEDEDPVADGKLAYLGPAKPGAEQTGRR